VGNDIVFAGSTPHGTLNAVYTFLEDCVGCRWWTAKASTIPKKPTLRIDPVNVQYNPPLEHREPYFPVLTSDADWSLRNKCNGPSNQWDNKLGGKVVYAGFVHTCSALIPPDKYFKQHPEWFAQIQGKRESKYQLCLTNQEMRRELVKNLKDLLRKNPTATIASVSQNDFGGNCQCEKCAALDSAEGSPSGSLLKFVNEVAADIEPQFPKVSIDTLAYLYTRKPPKTLKARKNVIIRFCTIKAAINKPLTDPMNKAFDDDLKGWCKICDRIYVWDYVTTFFNTLMPSQNMRVLGPNVRYFVDHKVKGIFEEGAGVEGSKLAEVKSWVLAKLLWDPSRDDQKLIDEFVAGYYGPAAKEVRQYIQAFDEAAAASEQPVGCFADFVAGHISIESLTKGWQHLQAARELVKDDPTLLDRIEPLEMSIQYEFIMGWVWMYKLAQDAKYPWPVTEDPQEMYDQFMKTAKAHNITKIDDFGVGLNGMKVGLTRAKAFATGKAPTQPE
jgi:hypothetical protein